jgi:hypothetical protein
LDLFVTVEVCSAILLAPGYDLMYSIAKYCAEHLLATQLPVQAATVFFKYLRHFFFVQSEATTLTSISILWAESVWAYETRRISTTPSGNRVAQPWESKANLLEVGSHSPISSRAALAQLQPTSPKPGKKSLFSRRVALFACAWPEVDSELECLGNAELVSPHKIDKYLQELDPRAMRYSFGFRLDVDLTWRDAEIGQYALQVFSKYRNFESIRTVLLICGLIVHSNPRLSRQHFEVNKSE